MDRRRNAMTRTPDNLNAALQAVKAGDLDALTPEQVARLERVLNDELAVAAQLGGQVPKPDERWASALDAVERPGGPSDATWERIWTRIDNAAPVSLRQTGQSGAARILRLWKPLAAAAACLLLAALWRAGTPATVKPWPMELATSVQIDQLEVSEGSTPFVVTTGGENGFDVIWVLQDEG
jgi:hypothetical protein